MTSIQAARPASEAIRIVPIKRLKGELKVPGDKSISHRAAIIASPAHGSSVLQNFSTAEDCERTVACLQALGVTINRGGSSVIIEGARDILTPPKQVLDAGNSGTTMRLLQGDQTISVVGGARLAGRELTIPGDVSSAAFFIAAACLMDGSDLTIRDVGLNPNRIAYLDVLTKMGAVISASVDRIEAGEPCGTVRVRGRGLDHARPFVLAGSVIPGVIDELPLLAFVAAAASCSLEVRDAAELRVKESDRIAATAKNLRAMGAEVEEFKDGFVMSGPARLRGARLDAFGDHRLAMALTVAALCAEGPSEIVGVECVEVSFPEFFQLLESVTER